MRRGGASDEGIAAVTPFSNNAGICSFPRFCENNEVESATDPERIRDALERAAVPTYPDLPTAVGFCMFVRRAAIADIGGTPAMVGEPTVTRSPAGQKKQKDAFLPPAA